MATSIIRNVFKFIRVYSFESSTCRKNLVISCRAYGFKSTISKNPLRCVSQSQVNKKPLSTHSLDDDVLQGHGEDTEVFEPINPDKGAQELLLIKPPVQPENPRCVRAAIIGTPNAGKSTLVNTLLGRRICAVSKKVHTTRRQATAVLTERDTQVIILDTPGMVNMSSARRHALPRELIVSPKSTLSIADLIIVIVDVADKWTCKKISTDILIELNNFRETPCILVLNKVDMLKNKQSLVELTALLTDGIIEGKAIEMSDRLTQKLLKNRGFRNKYLQYKGIGEETELNEQKDKELEVTEGGETEERLDIASSKEERLSEHSKSCDVENSLEDLNNESLHNMRTNNQLDSEELSNHHLEESTLNHNDEQIVFENHEIGLNSEKAEFLNQYINNLNGISKVYRPKETDNTDDEKNQQLEANRRKRELFKEFKSRRGWHLFEKVFMISAKTGDGVQELKEFVIDKATPQEWEYHKKVVTDLSPLQILEDAIREQLLECLEQEIPYNIDQRNIYWDYDESGTLLINQKLICYKKSHYGSILRRIRTIARCSEQDLMDAFHCDIMLKLSVVLAK